MAGVFSISYNYDVQFSGPLDNRAKVDQVSDLYTMQYTWRGMTVVIDSNLDEYECVNTSLSHTSAGWRIKHAGSGNTLSKWNDTTGGIEYSLGNVGINVSVPDERFHVDGKIKIEHTTSQLGLYNKVENGVTVLDFYQTNGTKRGSVGFDSDTNNTILNIINSGANGVVDLDANTLTFTTNSIERARINSTGFGINTNSPNYTLDVNGIIRSGESEKGTIISDAATILKVLGTSALSEWSSGLNIGITDDLNLVAGGFGFVGSSTTSDVTINKFVIGDNNDWHNTTKFVFDMQNDRLGIGIATPTEKLHLVGTNTNILINNTGTVNLSDEISSISFIENSETEYLKLAYIKGNSGRNLLSVRKNNQSGASAGIVIDDDFNLTLEETIGNGYKFGIHKNKSTDYLANVTSSNIAIFRNNISLVEDNSIRLKNIRIDADNYIYRINHAVGNNATGYIDFRKDGTLGINTGIESSTPSYTFEINTNKNVGIGGTVNDSYKLNVDGSINVTQGNNIFIDGIPVGTGDAENIHFTNRLQIVKDRSSYSNGDILSEDDANFVVGALFANASFRTTNSRSLPTLIDNNGLGLDGGDAVSPTSDGGAVELIIPNTLLTTAMELVIYRSASSDTGSRYIRLYSGDPLSTGTEIQPLLGDSASYNEQDALIVFPIDDITNDFHLVWSRQIIKSIYFNLSPEFNVDILSNAGVGERIKSLFTQGYNEGTFLSKTDAEVLLFSTRIKATIKTDSSRVLPRISNTRGFGFFTSNSISDPTQTGNCIQFYFPANVITTNQAIAIDYTAFDANNSGYCRVWVGDPLSGGTEIEPIHGLKNNSEVGTATLAIFSITGNANVIGDNIHITIGNAYVRNVVILNETPGLSISGDLNQIPDESFLLKRGNQFVQASVREETDRIIFNKSIVTPPGSVFIGDSVIESGARIITAKSNSTGNQGSFVIQLIDADSFVAATVFDPNTTIQSFDLQTTGNTDNNDSQELNINFTTSTDTLLVSVDFMPVGGTLPESFEYSVRLIGGDDDSLIYDEILTPSSSTISDLGNGIFRLTFGNPSAFDVGFTSFITISGINLLGMNEVTGSGRNGDPNINNFFPWLRTRAIPINRLQIVEENNITNILESKTGDDRLDASAIKNLPQENNLTFDSVDNEYTLSIGTPTTRNIDNELSLIVSAPVSEESFSNVKSDDNTRIVVNDDTLYHISTNISIVNAFGTSNTRLIPIVRLYINDVLEVSETIYIRSTIQTDDDLGSDDMTIFLSTSKKLSLNDEVRVSIQKHTESESNLAQIHSSTLTIRKITATGIAEVLGITQAEQVKLDNVTLNNLLSGSANVANALMRLDNTGLGANIVTFTGNYNAGSTNINQWFGNRQRTHLQSQIGQSNGLRTFNLPNNTSVSTAITSLESANLPGILTLEISNLSGVAGSAMSENRLTIAPAFSETITGRSSIILTYGETVTLQRQRVGVSQISDWEVVSEGRLTAVSGATLDDIELQSLVTWNAAPNAILTNNVLKGYAYKVINANINNNSRFGEVMYDGDWVVWEGTTFTSWDAEPHQWFVIPAHDVRRITQNENNFLQHTSETDTIVKGESVQTALGETRFKIYTTQADYTPADLNNNGQIGLYNNSNTTSGYLYIRMPRHSSNLSEELKDQLYLFLSNSRGETRELSFADDFTFVGDYSSESDWRTTNIFEYGANSILTLNMTSITQQFSINNYNSVENIEDGTIVETKLSSDLQNKINQSANNHSAVLPDVLNTLARDLTISTLQEANWTEISNHGFAFTLNREAAALFDENRRTFTGNYYQDVSGTLSLDIGTTGHQVYHYFNNANDPLNVNMPGFNSYMQHGFVGLSNSSGNTPITNTYRKIIKFYYRVDEPAFTDNPDFPHPLLTCGFSSNRSLLLIENNNLVAELGTGNGATYTESVTESLFTNSGAEYQSFSGTSSITKSFKVTSTQTFTLNASLLVNGASVANDNSQTFTVSSLTGNVASTNKTFTFNVDGTNHTVIAQVEFIASSDTLNITMNASTLTPTIAFDHILLGVQYNTTETIHSSSTFTNQHIGTVEYGAIGRIICLIEKTVADSQDSNPTLSLKVVHQPNIENNIVRQYNNIPLNRRAAEFDFTNFSFGDAARTYSISRIEIAEVDVMGNQINNPRHSELQTMLLSDSPGFSYYTRESADVIKFNGEVEITAGKGLILTDTSTGIRNKLELTNGAIDHKEL